MRTPQRYIFGMAAFLILLCLAPLASGQVTDWKLIKKPPLPAFRPQQPRRVELPNGMIIFLQENHELPLIRGRMLVRGGSREEPAEKVGLVALYGEVWRTGGTKSKTGDELDDFLEARAAKVETEDGLDATTVSFSCLKGDFEDVFRVFVELLREPGFREDKIPLAKNQLNTVIARRNDDPMEIAQREAMRLAYGANSPYARVPEYFTVGAVTREDLSNWHASYVHPNNMILGVVGDFDPAAMEAKLREAFASWPKGPAAKKAEVAFQGPQPGVYFIQKDDVNQSAIRMVHLGTTKDNPDYHALEVMNELFGGGSAARLFSNVRSKKGLAYYVYGGVGTAYDHPGVFQMGMGTQSEKTATAIDALFEELDGLEKTPATLAELARAKDTILNSFIFRFDSKEKVLRERMVYEFYGYPADFLERYRAAIEKVTREDVARVAHRYVHKDKLAILVVGKAADFDRPLSSFGPVTNVDITIPTAAAGKTKGPLTTNPEGKALLAKIIEGLGGEAKVRSVKSLRAKLDMQMKTPMGEMAMTAEQVIAYPDRFWQKMTMPMGEILLVVSPAAAFMKGPMGTPDLPASQKEDLLGEMKRDQIAVAQHADDPHYAFAAAGSEKVGEVEAKILDVNADGAEVRWFVDPQSGRILRATWQSTGPQGPGERVVEYGNWKTVEGVTFPFKETRTLGGEKEGSVEVKEIELNPAVDPKLFEKPA